MQFTDAPAIHPNFFVGSLHILFWFFFHPSAWRNHLTHIDSSLAANFSLAELQQQQWQNPILRRLLLQGFLVWPLVFSFIILLDRWLRLAATGLDIAGTAFGIIGVIVGSLALGTVVSVAGILGSCGVYIGFSIYVGGYAWTPIIPRCWVCFAT